MNSNVLRNLSYGVYVISTMDKKRPTGCVANSAMQITSAPATIAVSVNHDNYTNSCIKESGLFSVSIIAEETASGIIGTFGYSSGKDANKFDTVDYKMVEGVPVLTDGCGYLVCKVINQMETSTHTVFLGEIVEADTIGTGKPMTYSYYHEVIKGKSPKNAPTYLPEEETASKVTTKKKFKCKVCGYEIETDELPEDFKCPICGVGRDQFEEVK